MFPSSVDQALQRHLYGSHHITVTICPFVAKNGVGSVKE
jgi:hypothetical protein